MIQVEIDEKAEARAKNLILAFFRNKGKAATWWWVRNSYFGGMAPQTFMELYGARRTLQIVEDMLGNNEAPR